MKPRRILFEVLTGGNLPKRDAKRAARLVLGGANLLAAVFDTLETVESGGNFFDAAEKAWRRAQKRAEVLARVAGEDE